MSIEPVDFERLVAFACGELNADEGGEVQRSIEGSPDSASIVARLRDVLAALGAGALSEPRPALVARLSRIARPELSSRAGMTVRAIASLIFDSWAAPATGLRGSEGPRQLVFESDAVEVDLVTRPPEHGKGGPWRIRGQVTVLRGEPVTGIDLCRQGSSTAVGHAQPDAEGQFVLAADHGVYDLVVRHGSAEVMIEGLDVG